VLKRIAWVQSIHPTGSKLIFRARIYNFVPFAFFVARNFFSRPGRGLRRYDRANDTAGAQKRSHDT